LLWSCDDARARINPVPLTIVVADVSDEVRSLDDVYRPDFISPVYLISSSILVRFSEISNTHPLFFGV
jgi:hypothetical protein